MGLLRNRSLVVTGAVAAAVLLAAPPAFAEPAGADVEFRVVGNTVVEAVGKPVFVQLVNNGPGTADNIVVKVDTSKVDTSKIEIRVPAGCSDPAGGIFLCSVGSLVPGETNTGFSPFDIISLEKLEEGESGAAGSFSVEVTSDTPDPDPGNNKKVDVPLTVKPWAYDLAVTVQDIWAAQDGEPNPVKPGDKAPFVAHFSNNGEATALDPVWKVSLPPYVTFVSEDENLSGVEANFCTFNQPRTVATCKAPGIEVPRFGIFGSLFTVQVAKDAPGPAALTGGIAGGGALRTKKEEPLPPEEAASLAASKGLKLSTTTAQQRSGAGRGGDADPSDNVALFAAHVAANGADLAVTATSASGAVGAVVKITVTVENHGDASSPDTTLTVTAPTGTELVDMPTNCVFVTAGKVGKCEGLLSANEKSAGQFSFKIASTSVAKDGKAHIEGPLFDKVPANNDAAIVITIDNGLPITGAKVSVVAGTGAAVLLAGALLFFFARRRRIVLVTPSRDA